MLKKIDEKELDAEVKLKPLGNDIYALDFECNPLAFLKEGMRIWYKNEEWYDVYVLTENLPSSTEKEISQSLEKIFTFLS